MVSISILNSGNIQIKFQQEDPKCLQDDDGFYFKGIGEAIRYLCAPGWNQELHKKRVEAIKTLIKEYEEGSHGW